MNRVTERGPIMHLIIPIIPIILSIVLFILVKTTDNKKLKLLKIFSVTLFAIYLVRLFSEDVYDNVFNVLLFDVKTPIDPQSTWLFSPGLSVVISLLRWFTIFSILWLMIAPFFKKPRIWYLAGISGLLVSVLNIIFFKQNIIAFTGIFEPFHYRTIQFAVEIAVMILLSLSSIIYLVLAKEKIVIKKFGISSILIIAGSLFAVMPQTLLFNWFGNFGEVPKDFSLSHLLVMILPLIIMLIIYFTMRRKDQESKDLVITLMAVAAFIQYFYMRRESLAALPLHLCNTAVVLLFFAVIFKIKGFFYFAYFANVLGAIAAIILPNYSTDLFSFTVIHFGYNHLYAFIIPILGVALNTFERPKIRNMYHALVVFSVYFVTVIFLNAWFNNYTTVDYFFTYSDFLTDLFNIRSFQYNYIYEFNIGDLTFRFYWLFQLVYYLAFIVLMFASWYVYDLAYQMIDQNAKLKRKRKLIKIDHLRLLELLDGKDISEPINPEGTDMIKISNFSKKYGQSEKYAVKNFSLEVNGGDIFGFLGHNGAGKSTTIKSLVGIQSITEGEMEICGYSIKAQPLEAKLKIGYVSDNHAVYEKLTGREYIHYVADLYRVEHDTRDQRLAELATKLSLDHALDQMIKSYSHGMKQKLVVIASLIHEPPVWILDEPLTGLDPISSYQIKEIMKDHAAKGNIVFFSSHVIEVVEKICTKIVVITEGELTGIYDIDILKSGNISLEELYMQGIKKKRVGDNV